MDLDSRVDLVYNLDGIVKKNKGGFYSKSLDFVVYFGL